jgi:hypothetical protein
MAGFSDLVDGLQPPDFASEGAKLPEVSGRMPKYSRFRETAAGDWVRSALRGGRGSPISGMLRYGRWSGRTGDN